MTQLSRLQQRLPNEGNQRLKTSVTTAVPLRASAIALLLLLVPPAAAPAASADACRMWRLPLLCGNPLAAGPASPPIDSLPTAVAMLQLVRHSRHASVADATLQRLERGTRCMWGAAPLPLRCSGCGCLCLMSSCRQLTAGPSLDAILVTFSWERRPVWAATDGAAAGEVRAGRSSSHPVPSRQSQAPALSCYDLQAIQTQALVAVHWHAGGIKRWAKDTNASFANRARHLLNSNTNIHRRISPSFRVRRRHNAAIGTNIRVLCVT